MMPQAKTATTTFQTLYKQGSTGDIQFWDIRVEGDTIVTEYGKKGGKVQSTSDTIKEGKNVGKKNETSPEQQAVLEAQAKWEKKKKSGYVESPSQALAGEVDESVIEGGVNPMLAHKFSEQGHKIKYPCYAQPKLDGIRCIAVVVDGKCTLWTRTRKPITGVPHIARALELTCPTGVHTFDGELYNHGLKADFEKIVSFVRQEEAKPGHEVVEYHVYDYPSSNLNFEGRTRALREILGETNGNHLRYVRTLIAMSEDELQDAFDHFRGQGYEGAMARNADGRYENKRSYNLQKIKEFDDAEFEVVGIKEGRGKLQGHAATFVCKTADGTEFEAKMKGDTEMLRKYFLNHSLWKGKKLTVKYQGLTNTNKVPRFPVGVALRDYE